MSPEAELRIKVTVMARDADAQIKALEAEMAGLTKSVDTLSTRSKAATGVSGFFQQLSLATGVVAKLRVAGNGMGTVINGMGSALNKLESGGKSLQWAGRQVQQNFTLPILAAGAVATIFAMKNQTAFTQLQRVYTNVGGVVRNVRTDLGLLQRAFEALSNIYGVQQADVINLGVSWAKAGLRGGDLVVAVRATLNAMALSGMAAADASKGLLALRQQWGLTADGLMKAVNIINMVADNSAVSFGDLFTAVQNGGTIAHAAGIDLQHFTAMVAAMVPATGSAAAAGNSLKTIVSRLFAPTKTAAEVLSLMGINVKSAAWQMQNGSQRIETLAKSFGKLSSAQQIFAANAIGTRFQISRIDILLKSINDKTGIYNTLLGKTSSAQANAARSARDIAIYLSSTPQAFKIATTEIQNALAKAIVPLLPALIGVMHQIAGLVQSFTQLKPSTQQFILWMLLVVAVSGPLFRVLGATQVLLGLVGKTALLGAKALYNLAAGFFQLESIKFGGGGFFTAIGSGVRVLTGALTSAVTQMGTLVGAAMNGIFAGTRVAASAIGSAFSAAWGFIVAGAQRASILVGQAWAAVEPFFAAIGTAIGSGLSLAWDLVVAGAGAAATATAAVWEAAVPIFSAIGSALATATSIGFSVVIGLFGAIGAAAGAAFDIAVALAADPATWIVIAAVIAGALIFTFRKQIGEGFVAIGKTLIGLVATIIGDIGKLFAKLPGIVADVLRAVLRTIIAFGKAIWQALSNALNPWQRHSPSLVDLVTSGVDVIAAKYRSLSSIGVDLRSTIANLRAFGIETKAIADRTRNIDLRKKGDTIIAAVPGSAGTVNAMIAGVQVLSDDLARLTEEYGKQLVVVGRWKEKLDAANAALDVQTAKLNVLRDAADALRAQLDTANASLSTWSNTPIIGMRAMANAIFDNDQKTKGFQLQMMHLQDTFGTLDQMRSHLAAINGEIELASGRRQALHLKGAGSDVLGPIDKQLADLRKQTDTIGTAAEEMAKLQAEIDKSTNKGQELALQNDLTFGRMQHQIQDASTAMKEMPYGVILAHVKAQRAEVDRLTPAWEKANNKVKAQEAIVKQLTHARDGLQKSYDAEKAKLDLLGSAWDAIDGQINAITSALGNMASTAKGAADAVAAAFGAAGQSGTFGGGGVAGLLPSQADLDKLTKQLEAEVNKSFKKLDFGSLFTSPFANAWDGLVNWWESHVSFRQLWDWYTSQVDATARAMQPGMPGDISWIVTKPWHWIQDWWTATAGPWLGSLWRRMMAALGLDHLKNVDFSTPFKAGWHALQDWWDKTAFPWISSIPGRTAASFAKLPEDLRKAIAKIGAILIAPFKWVYDKLLGHSIIPDTVNGIENWFKKLPGKIAKAIGNLAGILVKWAGDGASWLFGSLGGLFGGVIGWFGHLPADIIGVITRALDFAGRLVGWVQGGANNLLFNLGGIFSGVINWFKGLPELIGSSIPNFADKIIGAFKGSWDGFASWWNEHIASIKIKLPSVDVGPIHLGGQTIGFPSLPTLGQGGIAGAVPGGVLALLAEAGKNELVAPLPTGFSMTRLTATLDRLERYVDTRAGNRLTTAVVTNAPGVTAPRNAAPQVIHNEYNFSGDLSFPSVENGDDAEAFIRNLRSLVD